MDIDLPPRRAGAVLTNALARKVNAHAAGSFCQTRQHRWDKQTELEEITIQMNVYTYKTIQVEGCLLRVRRWAVKSVLNCVQSGIKKY